MMNQLTRFCRIINRLSGLQEYVPAEGLLSAISGFSGDGTNCTVRTLQRDIRSIEEIFGVDIEFERGLGYHIVARSVDGSKFAVMLSDFQILACMDDLRGLHEYILPDHRASVISVEVNVLLSAIKDRRCIRFHYCKPVQDEVAQYEAEPYFIKQSQGKWYLLALVKSEVRIFELGRFRSFRVLDKPFERDETRFTTDMFDKSFGIWDDEKLPVEHIVSSVSRQEWKYLQTYPIHASQRLLSEDGDRVALSLDLRITHDLLMDLLSRAHSLRIISPDALRQEYIKILENALEINK